MALLMQYSVVKALSGFVFFLFLVFYNSMKLYFLSGRF